MQFNITNTIVIVGALVLCTSAYILYSHRSNYKNSRGDVAMTFNQNIFKLAEQNSFFRKELITGEHSQIVLMSIPVGGEIGMERHKVDQTLVFVSGHGQAIINGEVSDVYAQHLAFVPANTDHNFKNVGSDDLKLFTVYAPPQHKPGTIEKTKKYD